MRKSLSVNEVISKLRDIILKKNLNIMDIFDKYKKSNKF